MLRLCRAWFEIVSAVVPAARRAEWLAEWGAEVHWHVAERGAPRARSTIQLLTRCAGALPHALWTRKEEWTLDMLLHDLRYAVRQLAGRPAFTLLAVATLALGIGANTAIFSVVHGVLLKPLPYTEPDRLVQLWETNPLRNWTEATIAPANLQDWRARNRVFSDIAWYVGSDTREGGTTGYTLNEGREAEHVEGQLVGPNFFRVLGVQPAIGRDFRDDEATPGRHRVVLLAHGFWQRRFGGQASIVGSTIRMGPYQYLVAGIMPSGFRFGGRPVDFWAPLAWQDIFPTLRKPHFLRAIARLRPGVTVDAARREMTAIAAALEREYPETNTKMGVGLGPLDDWFVGHVRTALLVFLGAVGCLLLVVCANVANLMLSRAIGRAREIAIRSALGAGRLRLARQLLAESALLAVAGGGLGIAVASWGVQALVALSPPGVPRLADVAVDGWVLLFTAAVSGLTAFVFGLFPALHAARTDTAAALSSTARSGAPRSRFARRALVVVEVALAFVLVAGAGLMVRSFVLLQRVDPGFDPSNLLTMRIELPAQYDDDAKMASFFERVCDEIAAIPGVRAVGGSNRIALEGYVWTGDVSVEGRPDVWGRELRHKRVTRGYFAAMGLPLLDGRGLNEYDRQGAPTVVVVNETFAREFFPGESAVGRRVSFTRPSEKPRWVQIVGVVGDEKQDGLDAPVRSEVYESHLQSPFDGMTVVIRTAADPVAVAPLVRRAVARLDRTVAPFDLRTMDQRMAEAVTQQKLNVWIFGFFGTAALVLAALGVGGIVAFAVSSRTREFGVRVALGASRRDILRLVVLDGLRLALLGLGIGVALSVLLGRWLTTLLYQTAPADPFVLATVAGTLLAVALVAAYLPARAALRLDPIRVLRAE
jgi:putative ABC transport system permease protein